MPNRIGGSGRLLKLGLTYFVAKWTRNTAAGTLTNWQSFVLDGLCWTSRLRRQWRQNDIWRNC